MIAPEILPHLPGCYLFINSGGAVLYVGKARDLRKRVSSYFQKRDQDRKTVALLQEARNLEFIVTNTEVEALLLENTLIKRHQPPFNIQLKDAKRYAFIQLTKDRFPRLMMARSAGGDGEYFGPFVSARERDYLLMLLRKTFGLRTCRRLPKRPCLRRSMGTCSAPCTGTVTWEEYQAKVNRARYVLKGNTQELIQELRTEMAEHSRKWEYEQATVLRDEIQALERLQERQHVERQRKSDEDIIDYIVDGDNVYLMVFKVYKGTLEGREDYVFPYSPEFLDEFLVQYYSDNQPPEELILPQELDVSLTDFLTHRKGKSVRVTVPRRGWKKELLDLARINVQTRVFGDRYKLEALQDRLSLPHLPQVIECFDISHLSGAATVGSMVQFRAGRPDKGNYRRFRIKNVAGIDDPSSVAEVVRRRYRRLLEEGIEMPDLIVVDGGLAQLQAAENELSALGLRLPLISIAKREEKIFLPGLSHPLPINSDDRASLFIQEIRDEAHRFAITYHRLLRRKEFMHEQP